MKPIIHHSERAEKQMKRNFLIVKAFLMITPLICYCYVSLQGMMSGMQFQEVLAQNANITIIFLIAMINPYIAYLMHLIEKKLSQGETTFACINMGLLLVAQAMTMNVFYFLMLGYVFIKAIRMYHISYKDACKSLTWKTSFLYGGGSCLVVMLSSVCLFATIQMM